MHTLNRILPVLCCMTILLFLSGCTVNQDSHQNNTESNHSSGAADYNQVSSQHSTGARAAYSEKGYYFLVNGILYFYDINSDAGVPVCSNGSCSHTDSSCNAYMLDKLDYDPYDLRGIKVKGLGNQFWYSDGSLYVIERDEQGDYLMKYDDRYNNGKKVCDLTGEGEVVGLPSKNTENAAILFEHYLYYYSVLPVYAGDLTAQDYHTTVYCKRVSIKEGSKPELLGEFSAVMDYGMYGSGSGGKICAGKDRIYYVCGSISRFMSKNNPVQYKIYAYDITNGAFCKLIDQETDNKNDILGAGTGDVVGVGNNCCADDHALYIVSGDGKNITKLSDNASEVIYSNGLCESIYSLISEGNILYFMEAYRGKVILKAVDADGQVIDQRTFQSSSENASENLMNGLYIYGVDHENILLQSDDPQMKEFVTPGIEPSSDKYITTYAVLCLNKQNGFDNEQNIKVIYRKQK